MNTITGMGDFLAPTFVMYDVFLTWILTGDQCRVTFASCFKHYVVAPAVFPPSRKTVGQLTTEYLWRAGGSLEVPIHHVIQHWTCMNGIAVALKSTRALLLLLSSSSTPRFCGNKSISNWRAMSCPREIQSYAQLVFLSSALSLCEFTSRSCLVWRPQRWRQGHWLQSGTVDCE